MMEWGSHWQVSIREPNGHHHYRMLSKRDHPDQLSAYMAVAKELDKEQTNGSNT